MRTFKVLVLALSMLFNLTLQSVVRKCCPHHQSLDTSVPTYPICSLGTPQEKLPPTQRVPSLPNCKAEYEVHMFSSTESFPTEYPEFSWISKDGELLTHRYGDDLKFDNFCIDIDKKDRQVAVTCDPCKEKVSLFDVFLVS